MFRRTLLLTFVVIALTVSASDGRKTAGTRSRGSGRGSTSRRTNYNPQPAPTSFSNPAQAKEPTLFGWQTKAKDTPVRSSQTGVSHQSRAAQPSHSYPSSQTGLSGNQQPPSYQQAVQQSHTYPQNSKPQQSHTYPQSNANPGQSNPSYPAQSNPSQAHAYPAQSNPSPAHTYPAQSNPSQTNTYQNNVKPSNTQSHAYPASGGMSGHSGVGGNYPAQSGGLSGASPPAYQGGQPARPPASNTYPVSGAAGGYGNNYHPPPQGPPPGYGSPSYGHPSYGHSGGYGGGYGGYGGGHGGPGGFGGYNYNYGGMNRGMSTLTKVGIAGAGVSTLLTGLALYNLARSGNRGNTYIHQDYRGNPVPVPADSTAPVSDPILGELVNCTLTISGANNTEVIGIPCAIATSFSPNSDLSTGVDKSGATEEAKCTITVVTKNATEFSTTIPCSIFLNTAKEANVTEPPPLAVNGTDLGSEIGGAPPVGVNGTEIIVPVPLAPMPLVPVPLSPMPGDPALQQALASNNSYPMLSPDLPPMCKQVPGVIPDPLNPCVPALGDLSVIPLATSNSTLDTSAAAA